MHNLILMKVSNGLANILEITFDIVLGYGIGSQFIEECPSISVL